MAQSALAPPWTPRTILALVVAAVTVARLTGLSARVPAGPADAPKASGDTCAPCHRAIVEQYRATAMARTSGAAAGHVVQGSFVHARSGVAFEVHDDPGGPVLTFACPGAPPVRGTLPLTYYVGSNTRGRTFLFQVDGFLYQSPINYYTRPPGEGRSEVTARQGMDRGVWDMSPGYQSLTEMELNHPVDRTCLFCHATDVRRPIDGTINRFDGAAFDVSGVGCERCHGDGAAHASGRGPIVNPARLDPERRDAVCQQCHLEGRARIARAGTSLLDYRPGERLTDFVATFVVAGAAEKPLGAVSQVEALAVSRCKRASGDRMSCLSCHDPHGDPPREGRTEYFRSRCLSCHGRLAVDHHVETRACTTCHMPRRESADIAHTAVTDHRILARPHGEATASARETPLEEFGHSKGADARELGLAYAELAGRGDQTAAREAEHLLRDTAAHGTPDAEVLSELGFLEQRAGRASAAEDLYRRALAVRSSSTTAAVNLGVIEASRGDLAAAIALWAPVYESNPQLSELGLDLAAAECAADRVADARQTLARLLRHDPDRRHAIEMSNALEREPPTCLGPASGTAP